MKAKIYFILRSNEIVNTFHWLFRGIDAEKSFVVDAVKSSTNEITEQDVPSIESLPQSKTEELSLGENEIAGTYNTSN